MGSTCTERGRGFKTRQMALHGFNSSGIHAFCSIMNAVHSSTGLDGNQLNRLDVPEEVDPASFQRAGVLLADIREPDRNFVGLEAVGRGGKAGGGVVKWR